MIEQPTPLFSARSASSPDIAEMSWLGCGSPSLFSVCKAFQDPPVTA